MEVSEGQEQTTQPSCQATENASYFILYEFNLSSDPLRNLPCHCKSFTIVFCHKQEHFGRGKSSEFQLFSSPHGTDLMFKDSTQGFLLVPDSMDTWMYLGYMYVMSARNAREDTRKYPRGKV